MIIARRVARDLAIPFAGSRVVVQGFGNVGATAARLVHAEGCVIVGLSDVYGGISNPRGLDPSAVTRHMKEKGRMAGFPEAVAVSNAGLLELPCEFLIPAAIEGQITAENAPRIQARVIVEGANGPTTPEADAILGERGILVVPDILANAGGVIVSYFEWVQDLQSYFWSEQEINTHLERLLVTSYEKVAALSDARKVSLRTGALIFAVQRVADALMTRGIYP
jgi:glutamate dehydrogenase (NAD(P)+)